VVDAGGRLTAWKRQGEVSTSRGHGRAEEELEEHRAELEAMERECREEIEALAAAMDPMEEALETVTLTPYKKDGSAEAVGVVWLPYRVEPRPRLGAAW